MGCNLFGADSGRNGRGESVAYLATFCPFTVHNRECLTKRRLLSKLVTRSHILLHQADKVRSAVQTRDLRLPQPTENQLTTNFVSLSLQKLQIATNWQPIDNYFGENPFLLTTLETPSDIIFIKGRDNLD